MHKLNYILFKYKGSKYARNEDQIMQCGYQFVLGTGCVCHLARAPISEKNFTFPPICFIFLFIPGAMEAFSNMDLSEIYKWDLLETIRHTVVFPT